MSSIKNYYFSCYDSPYDSRDWLVKSFLDDAPLPIRHAVPDNNMTPIRSQGAEGSCVGFAMVAGIMEYLNNTLDYPNHPDLIRLSPRMLYELSKQDSGHSEGTTLRSAVKIAKDIGTCLEELWPYVVDVPDTQKNPDKVYDNAKKFKIKSYARVISMDDVKRAICNPKVKLVLAGVKVFKGMVESKRHVSPGAVPDPGCMEKYKSLGGHAICLTGYDDLMYFSSWKSGGGVRFRNSWGKKWGDNGYGFLSYAYLKDNMMDAFAIMDINDPNAYSISRIETIPRKNGFWV